MNYRKILFSLIAVALAAIMCVTFTSCNKDEKPPPAVNPDSRLIMKHWCNIKIDGSDDVRYGLTFNSNGTYSYVTTDRSVTGTYRIYDSQKSSGVVSYIWFGNEFETPEGDFNLYKLFASGSNDFDQIWVYYMRRDIPGGYYTMIVAHFFFNNELVEMSMFNPFNEP